MNKTKIDSVEKQNTVVWEDIDWRKVERCVFKLQKRIYKAVRCGNVKQARKLQKTLRRSWYNRLLAVRRVTMDNRGKNTAGVDGVKKLSPKQRIELALNLKMTCKSKPTRRVRIPKPGKDEKRPLGIPGMYDRALQGVVKTAIEPEWEARFEPSSYGFRPGRKAQDAVKHIKDSIKHKPKYVLDADIAKCFDRIDQRALLQKIGYKGKVRQQIKAWLKSGVIDNKEFLATSEGTPQGGVISPLLANIALHGLENILKEYAENIPKECFQYNTSKRDKRRSLTFIRYADDFVVMHANKKVVQGCKKIISDWLKGIGLELKPEKTRLTHTLFSSESEDGKAGFDFLGYHIQQFKASKYKAGKIRGHQKTFITLITPSKKNQENHLNNIKTKLDDLKQAPQEKVISELNPVIRGWSNYFTFSDAQTTGLFPKMGNLLYKKLRRWGKRQCKHSVNAAHKKFWHTIGENNWVFSTLDEKGKVHLALEPYGKNGASSIEYVKVKEDMSPYDGNLVYWSKRLGEHPEMSGFRASLLQDQKGKCAYCGGYFKDTDLPTMEIDHITPKSLGGKDSKENLQLLHGHCHDEKTREDDSTTKGLLTKLEKQFSFNPTGVNKNTEGNENTYNSDGELNSAQKEAINWVRDMVDDFREANLLKEDEYAFFKKYAEMLQRREMGTSKAMPEEYWEQGAKHLTCIMREKRYKTFFSSSRITS